MTSPSFAEAFRFWLKLGFISFGGPAGQIAIMHTELVDRKQWISESRFLNALNFCMLLPGPEAMQLATYCGWSLHGTRGGIVAGALFVLPGALLLWALSWLYAAQGSVAWVAAVFAGLKPAVTAIVAAAVIRIGRKALKRPAMWAVAAAAFVGIFFLNFPFPAIIAVAALLGWWLAIGESTPTSAREDESSSAATWSRAFKVTALCGAFWWAPVLVIALWQGGGSVWVHEAIFFSKAAMVTFGGAYAVLPYVGQEAVETHAWIAASQMVDGLALAETTPGPLILVLQFVGFLGGWQNPGNLSPLAAGTLGAAITTWTTFLPCFLWIFVSAPHIDRLGRNPLLSGALTMVTAAVVGVVLNLAVWFGWQVFVPSAGQVDVFAIVWTVLAFAALQSGRVGMVTVLAVSAAAGIARLVLA